MKLVTLIKICIKETCSKIRFGKRLSAATSDSHGREYEDDRLLEYSTLYSP
jgi:hypothetical protein